MPISFEKLYLKKQYRVDAKMKLLNPVGLDTETDPTENKTLLLAAENGRYINPESFREIVEFCFFHRFRGRQFVFYNLQFDVQAMLKWLHHDVWAELWEIGKSQVEELTLKLIPWKYFSISRKKQKAVFYDIAQFYGYLSLNSASKKYLNDEKKKNVDRVNISDFKDPNVIKYCVHDAKLAGDLARLILDISLKHFPKSPQSLVSKASVSEKHFLKTSTIPDINNLITNYPNYIKAGWLAYKGGFFSAFQKGYFPHLYVYDINSAYPYQMAKLPDLSQGRFFKSRGRPLEGAEMGWIHCRCDVDLNDQGAYFSPLAMDNKQVRFYPVGQFKTVITLLEYNVLKKYFMIEPLSGVYWIPNTENLDYPYRSEIERLYRWKQTEKDPVIKYYVKIILNSIYGKTVQKVPNHKTNLFDTGNLFNPFYGSYITAGTRIQLFKALLTLSPKDIVMVATDSIICKSPPKVPISGDLGEWGIEKEGRGIILGSGVYSIEDTDGATITKKRGFKPTANLNFLDRESLPGENTKIEILVKAHIGLARSLISKDYKRMNLILQENRSLDINFDYKRFWVDKFERIDDIYTKQIDSIPLDWELIKIN